MSKYNQDKANAFDMDTPASAGDDLHYGPKPAAGVPRSERIIAKPIPLDNIRPDPRQPRRAIPAIVLAGRPQSPRDALAIWKAFAEKAIGEPIDPVSFLTGIAQLPEEADYPAIVTRLFDLYGLAASIEKDSLMNPITVAQHNGGWLIETGERRWWAYNLLAIHIDADRYGKIPAREMDEHSVWRQAHENNNRASLSAIEKARQLAILLMDMWSDEREFNAYEDMVTRTGSDRPYYAQAANLNSRRGQAQRLMEAMGVSQRMSITLYKKLLTLTDQQWVDGDATNASLNELLAYIDESDGTSYSRTNEANKSSYVNHDLHNSHDKDVSNGSSLIHDIDRAAFPPSQRSGEGRGGVNDDRPTPESLNLSPMAFSALKTMCERGRVNPETLHSATREALINKGYAKIHDRLLYPTLRGIDALGIHHDDIPRFDDDRPPFIDPATERVSLSHRDTMPGDGRSGETYTIGIPPAPRGYSDDEWADMADDEREMILDDVTTNGSGGKLPARIPVPQVTRRSVIDQRARVFLSSLQELQQWHDSTNVNAVSFPANLLTWDSQQLAQQVVHQGWTRAHLQADYDAFVNHMDDLLTEYRAHVIDLMSQHLDLLDEVINEVNQQLEENN